MKSTVEQLSPTRVRINVEVPFTELQPDFERAYKALAKQVRLPGFRPGKAPAKLLEARLGRGAVLERVVNEALPSRYSEAVTSSDVQPLGQPDIEITKIEDGQELVFTAEVDVRPKFTLPELDALAITVDPIEIGDDDVDERLTALRSRFGTLTGVERAAADGDIVSIDLSATIDGEEVPDAATEGLAHEVGSGQLIEGLDEAIVGLKAGESKVFTSALIAGPQTGTDAQITVTVGSVKVRELPEADDEFAQLASEFDTIEELRSSLADQVGQIKRVQQAEKVRQQALDALMEQADIPLPEAVVQAQVDNTVHNALHSVDHSEARLAQLLAEKGTSREEFDADTRAAAEKSIKTQLLLDALADHLEIQVSQKAFSRHLVLMSRQYGMEPQRLLQYLSQHKQLPAVFADVRRSLAVAAAVRAATVTDTDGTAIDTAQFFGDEADEVDEADEAAADELNEAVGEALDEAEDENLDDALDEDLDAGDDEAERPDGQ